MWEQDWALLGIEPTTELAAIKKAYARKLKTTRPDDDADAYQALRGAYERVQQWLAWQQQQAAEAAPAEPPPPAAAEAPPPPPSVEPPVVEPPPEPLLQPHHLIDELELRWHRVGEPALLHAWDEARRELDQQPLARQPAFSAAFAQWVLARPELPDELLRALDAYFGWLNDFRSERQLGVELAHALHAALDPRLRATPLPPAVRELGAPLQALAALRGKLGWLRLQLLWLLLSPLLIRNQGLLGPDWLQRLGLDAPARGWLAQGLRRGLWQRAGLGTALVAAAGFALLGDAVVAAAHALTWLVVTGCLAYAGLALGMLLQGGPPQRRPAQWLQRWRHHRMQPTLGLVWLLFAAWMAWLAQAPAGTLPGLLALLPDWLIGCVAFGFALAGLLAAWPLVGVSGCVVAGLAPLVGSLFAVALAGWLPLSGSLLLAAAWMLLAAAVDEERLRLPGPALWLLRPMLNSLALGRRWTYSVALLPLAAASAYVLLAQDELRASWVFLIWVLGNLVVAWLQDRADAWGLKQLPAPAGG